MSESTTTDPAGETPQMQGRDEPEAQKWLSGIVSLIGLWIAASPFVYEAVVAFTWNNVVIGGAIFLLAGYNYYRIVTDHPTSTSVMSLVALLALWTLVAPFALEGQFAMEGLEVAASALVWSNVVFGIIAAAMAAYIAYAGGRGVRAGTAAGTR
ncbi:hypothetical protein EA462_07355 [Natrarchaeobius halalkaliphilus]|uniref:SPW repeat-containing integral membrane domain-containing protein n=1 Tax=Natrarchaeobius halalkaliphilus TaxID=1679091 RepID=A0A3N6M8N3_9EURY|nr:SPW repeat protein [Natrarchaeobius halalkaliphilus]RQG89826.1 hypothetical protein EA462_07355 [Natrarchaeobius halalkaliphilus]